ncbi:MAG: RAD55 family ATPase [Candidatus Micrarchaeota archaeon]
MPENQPSKSSSPVEKNPQPGQTPPAQNEPGANIPAQKNQPPQNPPAQKTFQSGVQALDSLFGGAIPQGSNVLVYGEPMCGKKLILMRYIYEGLKSQLPAILILTDFGYAGWSSKMRSHGMDLAPFEKSGLLRAVDCYSKQFEPSLQNTDAIKYAQGPWALSEISVLISEAQESLLENYKSHRLAFHSLSSTLEESDSQEFYKFLQAQTGKLRKNGAASLFSLEKGMHSQKEVSMIEHLMDGMVEFEEGKVKAKGLGSNGQWREYSVESGILQIK